MAIISITLFLLAAEGITRLSDKYADKKIAVAIDDGGSRLKDYTIEKKPGVFRILVLGDSITYGQGVHKNDTFAKKIELSLNRDSINRRFEVINTGFCGINTTQELWILLNKGPEPSDRPELSEEGFQGLAYQPDLILLQYTIENDAVPSRPRHPEELMPHRWSDDWTRRYNYGDYALPFPKTVDKWLTRHSKFHLFFLNKYQGFLSKLGLRNEAKRIINMYKPESMGWQDTQAALKQISHLARTYLHVPVVMILWANSDAGSLKEIYSIVGEFGGINGFHVLDLSKAVRWSNENFAVSKTDGHPNAKAHKIAAEAIYKFIKENRLVP